MQEEDKQFFTNMFNKLEKKVEDKAEEHNAKFKEIGSHLCNWRETHEDEVWCWDQNDRSENFCEW